MANAIQIIAPYRYNGTWVFDDPAVELEREPFVAGIPEMIDTLVGEAIGECNRFRLLFADRPFPGSQIEWFASTRKSRGTGTGWQAPRMTGGSAPRCSNTLTRLRNESVRKSSR